MGLKNLVAVLHQRSRLSACAFNDLLKFAVIKPQAVMTGANVHFYGGAGQGAGHHALAAMRAFAFSFSLKREGMLVFCLELPMQDQVQFALIQPDASARKAMIEFHLIELDHQHALLAYRAIHTLLITCIENDKD